MITDHAIGQHGEGVRIVAEKHARSLHANAAAPVRMIHENKFTVVGVRLFQRRKLSRFGAEDLSSWFFVLRSSDQLLQYFVALSQTGWYSYGKEAKVCLNNF